MWVWTLTRLLPQPDSVVRIFYIERYHPLVCIAWGSRSSSGSSKPYNATLGVAIPTVEHGSWSKQGSLAHVYGIDQIANKAFENAVACNLRREGTVVIRNSRCFRG